MGWRPSQVVDYAQRTYDSPHLLVRFAHRRRFASALAELRRAQPAVVVDYGAGDGHLIEEILRDPHLGATRIIAFEPVAAFRKVISERLARHPASAARVALVDEPDALAGRSAEVVLVLGVLEHLPMDERVAIYRRVTRLLGSGGVVIVGVPVESGLPLLVKNLGRRFLKGDVVGSGLTENLRGLAGRVRFDPRRYLAGYPAAYFLHHRGFDHRLLRAELAVPFVIERVWCTPFPAVPALLAGHEIYFRLRPRSTWSDADPTVLEVAA